MVEGLKDFLSAYPRFEDKVININYLGSECGSVSLNTTMKKEIKKKYADGGMVCERNFVLAIRLPHSEAITPNWGANQFCEEFISWLAEMDKRGRKPVMPSGCYAVTLKADKGFNVISDGGLDARYEIELSVIFYTEK